MTQPACGPVAIPAGDLRARVVRLAADLRERHPAGCLVVALAPEGLAFAHDLAAAAGVGPATGIALTRFRDAPDGRATVLEAPAAPLADGPVVLAATVVDTGLRVRAALAALAEQGADDLAVCALLDRRARRLVELPFAGIGFDVPDCLYAGYGLGADRGHADLPDLHYLDDRHAVRGQRESRARRATAATL